MSGSVVWCLTNFGKVGVRVPCPVEQKQNSGSVFGVKPVLGQSGRMRVFSSCLWTFRVQRSVRSHCVVPTKQYTVFYLTLSPLPILLITLPGTLWQVLAAHFTISTWVELVALHVSVTAESAPGYIIAGISLNERWKQIQLEETGFHHNGPVVCYY